MDQFRQTKQGAKQDFRKSQSVQRTPIMRSIQNAKKPTLDNALDSLLAERMPSSEGITHQKIDNSSNPFKPKRDPAGDISQIP